MLYIYYPLEGAIKEIRGFEVVCDRNLVSVSGTETSIGIGAIIFSAETEIAFSTNFGFCLMADWKI